MKIKSLFAMGLSLCAMVILTTACSDYDGSYDITHEMVLQNYENNFIERYGQPDPNHNWGFGKYTRAYGMGANAMGANVVTRGNYAEKNMWLSSGELLYVPGWPVQPSPDCHGKTNVNTGGEENIGKYLAADGNAKNHEYLDAPDYNSHVPGGDVTDEEIAYVSWWFRTHKNPESGQLPKENFFIQGISADNDRSFEENTNDNKQKTKGVAITQAPLYELQQDGTYKQTGTRNCEIYSVDYLHVKGKGDDGQWVPVKDLNYSNSNSLVKATDLWNGENQVDGYITGYRNDADGVASLTNYSKGRIIDFYWAMDTNNFKVWNSGTSSFDDTWALVNLDFTINGHHYNGWYIGFDLEYYYVEEGGECSIFQDLNGNETTNSGEWIGYEWVKNDNGQNYFKDLDGNETTENGKFVKYEWIRNEYVVKKYACMPHDGYYSNWIFKLTPSTVMGIPTETDVDYTVYYRYKYTDENGREQVIDLAEPTHGTGAKGSTVNLEAKDKDNNHKIVYNNETYTANNNTATLTLDEETNTYIFWYNKDGGTTTEEPKKATVNIELWEISKDDYSSEVKKLHTQPNVATPEVGTYFTTQNVRDWWATYDYDGVKYILWEDDPYLSKPGFTKTIHIDREGAYTIKFYYTAPDPAKEYAGYTVKYVLRDGGEDTVLGTKTGIAEVGTDVVEYAPSTYNGYNHDPNDDSTKYIYSIQKNGTNEIIFYYVPNPAPSGNTIRVFCEDLGSTSDFDFNDIVFDATFNDDSTITIQPLAAGGTLPIYVGGQNTEWHEMFGQTKEGSLYIPINVNANSQWDGKTAEPFTVSGTYIEDVKIVVGDINNPDSKTWEITNANYHTNDGTHVPQMIGVKYQSTRWTKESQQIEDAYGNFKTWVGDKDFKNWYETITNSGLLY